MEMRSCFLLRICALTARFKCTADWARNPAQTVLRPEPRRAKPSSNSSQGSRNECPKNVGVAAFSVGVAAFCSDSGNTLAASFTSNGATQSAEKKLCERLIATSPKCATIGTVQESFPASHGTSFIQGPEVTTRGRQRHSGSCERQLVGREAKAFRQ